MLSSFRAHIKGWLAWALIIIISVPFALWGIGNYSSVITSNAVATVNGKEILPQAFQNAYRSAVQQRQVTLGGKYDPTPAEVKALKQKRSSNSSRKPCCANRRRSTVWLPARRGFASKFARCPFFR